MCMKMSCTYGRTLALQTRGWCQILRHMKTMANMTEFDFETARPFEEVPGPKGLAGLPGFGVMFLFKPFTKFSMEEFHLLYNHLLSKYGPLVRVRLRDWSVLVQDPNDIEIVMKNEGKYPERIYSLLHAVVCEEIGITRGLGHLNGEDWYKFRTVINPRMMRVKSAQYYLPQQNDVADDLVSILRKDAGKSRVILDLLFKYACESISVVTFNKRLGFMDPDIKLEKQKILGDIQLLFGMVGKGFFVPPFLLRHFPLKLKSDYKATLLRVLKETKGHYKEAVKDIKRQQEEGTLNPEEHNFMMSLLIKDKLTTEEMGTIANELFSAGTESTTRNLQLVLYTLARYPNKQQKLREEILDVLGLDGPLTAKALSKMPYLLACVKESFRLRYPIQSGTQRFLPTDIVLRGYRIPAGTSVCMVNPRTVMDEKYFPSPEEFRPERWLRDEEGKRENPIPSSALLPFGFGPRQCLGKRFAEQEIYLAITKVVQKLQINLEPGHEEVELHYRIFPGTKRPVRFVFNERA